MLVYHSYTCCFIIGVEERLHILRILYFKFEKRIKDAGSLKI